MCDHKLTNSQCFTRATDNVKVKTKQELSYHKQIAHQLHKQLNTNRSHNLATSVRRVTPVCRCLHPFCGWMHLGTSKESKT